MKSVIDRLSIDRRETGEIVSSVVLTFEQNGYAIWFEQRGAVPRLLAWHTHRSHAHPTGAIAAAHVEFRRIAREAIDHGTEFAAHREFVQR